MRPNSSSDEKMLALLCKKLGRNPSFLRNIDGNASPVRRFFSTEAQALDSGNEDGGKGILSSLNNNNNNNHHHPRSTSSSSVAGAQDDSDKASEVTTKTLLRRYGFTDSHLSKLHTLRPSLFTSVAAQKALLPNLEFFRGLGFSNADLPKLACLNPYILCCSLQNQLVPWYNFMKDLQLLSSDSDSDSEGGGVVKKIMKRDPRLINCSIKKTIAPNVAALREAGVPHSRIFYLLRTFPASMGCSSLPEYIKEAAEMGFDPNKTTFVGAVRVFVGMSKSTRDMKMEVFRKCGMTDAHILKAFRSHPNFMSLSKGNIEQTMDFVVKRMGWKAVDVARYPALLKYSLEKRIIPRCTVVRYLQGKGLLKKTISFSTFLNMKEEDFVDTFVKKYEDHVPGLMDIYLAKTIQSETAGLVGKR